MGFNPLQHKGIPLDRQLRAWRELDSHGRWAAAEEELARQLNLKR